MMTLKTSTLRPGILVSLKTTVSGNVSYDKRELVAEHVISTGEQIAKWETERTVTDPVEHEAAIKVRSKARGMIVGVCAQSAFGLLCPADRADQLEIVFTEANRLASEFNRSATLTKVGIYMIAGQVSSDDEQAIRSINSEVSDLMAQMESGLRTLDPGKIREACTKARGLASMLSPESSARVKSAIDAARKSAREIVKAGESAAIEIDLVCINQIQNARTAFLDTDDDTAPAAVVTEATRAVDMSEGEAAAAADQEEFEQEVELEREQRDQESVPAPAPQARFAFELED